MRYHFSTSRQTSMYGIKYACNHPLYSFCTLFKIGDRGIAVIQQRFDPDTKTTWWSDIDTELQDEIYLNTNFKYSFYQIRFPKALSSMASFLTPTLFDVLQLWGRSLSRFAMLQFYQNSF